MIVFRSEDDGTLYAADHVDIDPATGQAEGYTRYELDDTIILTAEQVLGGYGDVGELLGRAGVMRRT